MSKQLQGEVDGVIDYAKDAVTYKTTDPALADMYFRMANTEHGHVKMLHDQLMKKIKEARESGTTYPADMEEKWDKQHKKLIAKMEKAKTYLDMYK